MKDLYYKHIFSSLLDNFALQDQPLIKFKKVSQLNQF